MQCADARVLAHEPFKGAYRLLRLACAPCAASAKPGQFVHLRIPGIEPSALRRPFSISGVDADGGLEVLYKAVGRGTHAMTALVPGAPVNLMGPLGNGFPAVCTPPHLPVLVAGGYGVAPLSFLASRLNQTGIALIGGRSAIDILFEERFRTLGWETRISTEDGSLGTQGRVTDVFDAWSAELTGGRPEVFACGPDGLLKALSDRARAAGFDAWLSLDKHMGCGVGVCLACVQRLRAADGGCYWGRVCREGPVFESRQIVWDDAEDCHGA